MAAVKWTERMVREEAAKFSTKWEFGKTNGYAYKLALRLGIIDDLGFEAVRENWTEEKVRALAEECSTKKEFETKHPHAYECAVKTLKIINDLFGNQRRSWGIETLRAEAAKYPGKIEFKQGCPTGYKAATRLGVLDQLGLIDRDESWTEEKARERAALHLTATDFMRADPNGYAAARRFGILSELGFELRNSADNNAIYIWRAVGQYFNGEPVYKVGVTSARLGHRRVDACAKSSGFEYTIICCEPVRCKATDLEKRLLLLGCDPGYCDIDGATEFRAMSDAVVWVALGLISEVVLEKK